MLANWQYLYKKKMRARSEKWSNPNEHDIATGRKSARETMHARAREWLAKIGPLIPDRKRAWLHARCSDSIDENCNGLATAIRFDFARESSIINQAHRWWLANQLNGNISPPSYFEMIHFLSIFSFENTTLAASDIVSLSRRYIALEKSLER